MDIVLLAGRVLFGALFLQSAVAHLRQTSVIAGYAASRGLPMPKLATQLTGVQIALGGFSVILGIWGDLGALLLAAFLLGTAILIHGFWTDSEPMAREHQKIQFNKDVALAGGALAFFWVFSQDAVGLTLTGPLF